MGDEAHSGSYHGSYGLTHARFTHRHRRHALPLHTRSSTTPPKHSPDQNGQGLPLGDPGSLWLATALGSSAAVSRSRHDSTPTASFEVRLVDLLSPRPPRTCSSHRGSTPGPLVPVVAACVKDAQPSRWLAPLKRPRWRHHRPSLKQSAGARAAAVAGGPTAMGLVDFSRREGSRAACGACAWIAPSGAGFIRDPEGEALAKTALMASISGVRYLGLDIGPTRANRSGKNWL